MIEEQSVLKRFWDMLGKGSANLVFRQSDKCVLKEGRFQFVRVVMEWE